MKKNKKSTMGKAAQKMLVGGMTEEQEAVLTPIPFVHRLQ